MLCGQYEIEQCQSFYVLRLWKIRCLEQNLVCVGSCLLPRGYTTVEQIWVRSIEATDWF